MLLDTLGVRLLENILVEKGMNKAGQGILRASYENIKTKTVFNVASSFY